MESAEGQVQHLKYSSTFPLLLNISDRPTYFMSLKDGAGLVKMYAFVDVSQYQIVGTGSSVEEARPVLEALYAHYPMVLVSNFYGNVEMVLADFDLARYFKKVVESAVVGIRKPDPRIFALGVEALGVPAENVLVVGDSYKKDIVPAESIGCQVAWLKGKGWTAEEDAVTHPEIIKKL